MNGKEDLVLLSKLQTMESIDLIILHMKKSILMSASTQMKLSYRYRDKERNEASFWILFFAQFK